tara:strand:+ start:514 stop:1482 length:969 start_codon:yes stop_codon:yes gene_type:complete
MPKISILTPTYNRAEFLPKLAESLQKQSFQDIEWIIGNDGSNDNSDEVIRSFAEIVQFPIIYINSSHRVGKSKIDNLLIDESKGEYILWCDSDDSLVEDALEYLICEAEKISNSQLDYVGVMAQNVDNFGVSQTFNKELIPQQTTHLLHNEIGKYVIGDATYLILAAHLKGKKFLEVDFLIIEASLLFEIFNLKKVVLSPKVVKIMDRTAENSVSFGKKLSYCKGSAYAISKTLDIKRFKSSTINFKFRSAINYFRYTFHGDIALNDAIILWPVINSNRFWVLIYPIAILFAMKDKLLGKVEKTHLEFEKNIGITRITKQSL